jgi:hypothetical protein
MKRKLFRAMAATAVATSTALITACGGGGGGGDPAGGIGGSGTVDVSVGAITAFGSVWVNGVEFKSNTATIKIDDTVHPESDLRVGMIARVDGSIDSATASTISVGSAAKGVVESVNGNQLVVLGQSVVIDAATVVANGPIAPGNLVEVHGLVLADGTISATFIERKTALGTPPFAVKGLVKAHNATTNAFSVGALNVVLGAGAVINDMPVGSWNGLQVEVKGTACAGNPPTTNVCGTLTASKVEPHGPRGEVAKVEVEGFIMQFASAASFSVGNQPVVTTAATVFEGGVAGDLGPGSKVEVEGRLSGGVLTAVKVSLRESARFEANLATKAASSFTIAGLPGITVEVNAQTRFKNVANLAALSVGNNLKVRARPGAGNTVVATEVEQKSVSPDTRLIIQGIASAVADPNVTLLGITVNTSPMTSLNQFKDINDNPIGRAAFFAAAAPGKLIKARGTLNVGSGTVAWDQEIQLED